MTSKDEILALKRKALACKKDGDIEAAKSFLRQAKQLEQTAVAVDTPSSAEPETNDEQLLHQKESTIDEEYDPEEDQPRYEDPVNKAIDEANLEELEHRNVRFTDNELIDFESMADLRTIIMAEQFPTESFYQERIMTNKRAALAKKQANDIPAAKKLLMTAKQLEKACTVLFQGVSAMDDDEEDGEDYSLLDELIGDPTNQQNDDGFFEQLFGKSATILELDDLDDMDAALLRDMMEAGMQVPSVEDVLQSAEDRKTAAVALKKDGNLEAAKAALLESKRLTSKANQLSTLLKAIENGVPNESIDPELALENMLKTADEIIKTSQKPQEETAVSKKLLSSVEYRAQAVQHRQLGNKDEAIAALRLYKEALALEEKAKAAAQKKEWILELRKEDSLADEQARRFVYYSQFIDSNLGSKMVTAWRLYARACSSLAMALEKDELSSSFSLQRRIEEDGLQEISDTDLSFVGTSCDPAECRIEFSLLELMDIQNNKHLREKIGVDTDPGVVTMPEAPSMRVVLTVHLPQNAEGSDDSEQILTFTANSLLDYRKGYFFGQSQYIHGERGTSRFAKLFTRRLTRKRCVSVEVFYSHTIVTKGLFSNSLKTEEILLGSATIELKELQEKNFIAMDLPLVQSRREVGGKLRLAIRSGSPFCEQANAPSDTSNDEATATTGLGRRDVGLESYSQVVFPP